MHLRHGDRIVHVGHAETPCLPAELDEFAATLMGWGLVPRQGADAADFFTRDVKTYPTERLTRRASGQV